MNELERVISAYLASGWFSPQQKTTMDKVRNIILDFKEIKLFSPFYDGIVLDKNNDSPEKRKEVFDIDIGTIAFSDLVVVVIDDFEPGTIFEMGAAAIIGWMFDKSMMSEFLTGTAKLRNIPRVLAYSDVSGRGLNVMLQQSVWGFANGEKELRDQLNRFICGERAFDYLGFTHGDFV